MSPIASRVLGRQRSGGVEAAHFSVLGRVAVALDVAPGGQLNARQSMGRAWLLLIAATRRREDLQRRLCRERVRVRGELLR